MNSFLQVLVYFWFGQGEEPARDEHSLITHLQVVDDLVSLASEHLASFSIDISHKIRKAKS